MPNGPPFQFAPKSMWSFVAVPIDAMIAALSGSTALPAIGVFHALLDGNGRLIGPRIMVDVDCLCRRRALRRRGGRRGLNADGDDDGVVATGSARRRRPPTRRSTIAVWVDVATVSGAVPRPAWVQPDQQCESHHGCRRYVLAGASHGQQASKTEVSRLAVLEL
jgi:hypothetical protein